MKMLKTAVCGILLATASWIPSFATGLEEAAQVSSDPYVAYTLYENMPVKDAIRTFDALPDWVKKMEYIKIPNYDGPIPLTYTYTRTLEDKTKQILTFEKRKNEETLGDFTLLFYTKNVKDAIAMYEQAYHNIDSYKKWSKAGSINHKYATFWDDTGYTIYLELDKDKKLFSIRRSSVSFD